MANKKAAVAPKADCRQIGNWALWLGLLVAIITPLLNIPYQGLILILLGVMSGYRAFVEKEAHHTVVYVIGFWVAVTVILPYLETILINMPVILSIVQNFVVLAAGLGLTVSGKGLLVASGLLKQA